MVKILLMSIMEQIIHQFHGDIEILWAWKDTAEPQMVMENSEIFVDGRITWEY